MSGTTLATIVVLILGAGGASLWQGPRVTFSPESLAGLPERTRLFVRLPPPPYWAPATAQIHAAETALHARLPGHQVRFGRQYLGLTVEGRRTIQLRGFCENYYAGQEERLWERSPVMLLDAGGCAFQVDYDPGSRRLGVVEWGTPGP
jgi:hypothetical protein